MSSSSSNCVMTVCGPVKGGELGFTLTHEHLILGRSRATRKRDGSIYDRELALQEIMRYRAAGGSTLLDLSNGEMVDAYELIRWLSRESGLNIVMGCGWYTEPHYSQRLWRQTTSEVAAEMVQQIENGFGDTGIRPGVIGEIGADKEYVSPVEERVFRAVARAQARTGLAVITHAVDSPVGLTQLDLLEEEGANLRRVAVAHCETYPDPDYHETLARRGAYAQFDIAGRYPHETEYQLRQVMEFIRRGHLEHLLISHDIYLRSHLVAYGGKGYAYVAAELVDVLLDRGLSREQVDTIFIRNPARLLIGEEM